MNSCDKGKRGERAWRDVLIEHGYTARRGQQFSGTPDSPDVICPDLPGFHFEVKTVERLNIHAAVAQSIRDAGKKIPVVAHKRSRSDWLITMRASDWLKMLATAKREGEARPDFSVVDDPPDLGSKMTGKTRMETTRSSP
jgi:hypothetical protein